MMTVIQLLIMLAKVLLYVTIALAFAGICIALTVMPFGKKRNQRNGSKPHA